MNHLRALSSALLVAGLMLVGVALMWGVGQTTLGRYFVPTPGQTAEEFLRAMEAHRYEAAHKDLSDELSQQVSVDEIRRLVEEIEEREGGITKASAETIDEGKERATAQGHLRFGGKEREVTLPLVKQQGTWRVASIDGLRA